MNCWPFSLFLQSWLSQTRWQINVYVQKDTQEDTFEVGQMLVNNNLFYKTFLNHFPSYFDWVVQINSELILCFNGNTFADRGKEPTGINI